MAQMQHCYSHNKQHEKKQKQLRIPRTRAGDGDADDPDAGSLDLQQNPGLELKHSRWALDHIVAACLASTRRVSNLNYSVVYKKASRSIGFFRVKASWLRLEQGQTYIRDARIPNPFSVRLNPKTPKPQITNPQAPH